MGRQPKPATSFRVGRHLVVVISVLYVFFGVLGVMALVRQGIWAVLLSVLLIYSAHLLLLRLIHLELRADGLSYRNLAGLRQVDFRNVKRGVYGEWHPRFAGRGGPAFWLEMANGRNVKINLRTLPRGASVALKATLESHGIPIVAR